MDQRKKALYPLQYQLPSVIDSCRVRRTPVVTQSTGTKPYNATSIVCPKTIIVPLTVYIFADEATIRIGLRGNEREETGLVRKMGKAPKMEVVNYNSDGRLQTKYEISKEQELVFENGKIYVPIDTKMGRVHYTLDGTPFRPYQIDVELIAAYIHVIFNENKSGLVVNAKGITDTKTGEKDYKLWQKKALDKMTIAYGKIVGTGNYTLGDDGGDFKWWEEEKKAEMEAHFKSLLQSTALSPGNYRYDYDYYLAYIFCHEIIHWQLEMMYYFYGRPNDFETVFGLQASGHVGKDVFGEHLNTPAKTFYFRPDDTSAERVLPEQACGIKMFLEDYYNMKILNPHKPQRWGWPKIREVVNIIRKQRIG